LVECKWAGTVSVTGVGSEDWFTTGRKVDVLGLDLIFQQYFSITILTNQTKMIVATNAEKVLVVMIRKTTKPDERPPLASLLLV